MSTQDYYQILGVGVGASGDEIKRAYRKLSLKYHPDKTPDKSHHELFLQIGQAYGILGSPESRNKYDTENGLKPQNTHTSNYFPTQTHTSKSLSTSFYTSTTTRNFTGGGGYYGYYQHVYGRKDDQQRKHEEERTRFENEQLKREMLERAKAQEAIRRREEIKRQKMEAEAMAAAEILRATNAKVKREQEELYNTEKRRAQEAAQKTPETPFQDDALDQQYHTNNHKTSGQGSNSKNPIVLDDENEDKPKDENLLYSEDDTFYSVHHDEDDDDDVPIIPQTIPEESIKFTPRNPLGDYDEINSKMNDLLNGSANIRPRPEPGFRRSASPKRPSVLLTTSHVRKEESPGPQRSAKRAKTNVFAFDDLEKNLGENIDNVDFTEMLNNLPKETSNNRRKVSEDRTRVQNKRVKTAEYSNGTSKAETLFTPINKLSIKGHPVPPPIKNLTMTMLLPSSSSDLQKITPPNAILDPAISLEGWNKYVKSIETYQDQFTKFKKSFLQYQVERIKKDEKYHSYINSNINNFELYQRCLQQDLELQQDYTSQLRIYNTTMSVYKQNCRWMDMSDRHKD